MKVYQTGIRSGEYITSSSTAKQNRGSLFQVRGNYPPSREALPSDEYSWSILLQQLETIPFFADLSHQERKEWLVTHATPNKDLYLQDVPLQVKVVKLEGKFFREKLDEHTIDRLIAGNPEDTAGYWNLSYIYNLIPRKPGSRAQRHTLIFRPGNWQIYNSPLEDPQKLHNYTGLVIDLNTVTISNANNASVDYLVPLSSTLIGIRTGSSRNLPEVPSDYAEIKALLDWATPSVHKSLIQKILRTGCSEIIHNDKTLNADEVLTTSFLMLLAHAGSFVPDIQRYVSGQESALKRLAVSICEDAYTENYAEIMVLYAAALLTQVHSHWHPTAEQIARWCQLAIASKRDTRYFKYNTQLIVPLEHSQMNAYTLSHLLLNEIRSFQTDINMVGSIDGFFEEGSASLHTLPLIHCIDHHNITDLGYYFPYGTCVHYSQLFKLIWEHSSRVNPRKQLEFFDDNTLKCIRYAQQRIWEAKTYTPEQRAFTEGSTEVKYTLSDQWLAGLLGPIRLQVGRSQVLVSLHPENIYTLVPVKRPTRNDREMPQLTSEEQIQAVQSAQELLIQGCALKGVPGAMPWFQKAILFLYEGEYVLKLTDNTLHLWRELCNTQCSFRHHLAMQPTLENSIQYRGEGFDEKASAQLSTILDKTASGVLRRLLVFLTSARSTISLFKISRDGSGQEYAVSPLDTEVFHILSALCVLYPGAISKLNTRQFKVRYGPFIWQLREQLLKRVQEPRLYGVKEWGHIGDLMQRTLWPHQISAWQKMSEHPRGHLLWIPVGMGKTLIVMRYLQHLLEEEKMPKYVLYTLPPSAIENTIKEVQAFGFRCHLMDLRVNAAAQAHVLQPFTINLVKHDHLRLGGDLFREAAEDSLVVVDEFHLTLNKTLRTSMALELSKTAYDFIGLSGTVIQSENVEDLIQWLQQIVDFEVTTENFWVAVSAMISNRVETGVKVVHYSHEIDMPTAVKTDYLALVGASLGGHNPKPTQRDFRDAVVLCHEVCLKEIVATCLQYYNSGQNILLVAKDIDAQHKMKALLCMSLPEHEIVLLGKDQSIAIGPYTQSPIRIAITTIRHSTGYTFTKAQIMITSVYFSKQATREQLEGRINRIGQIAPEVCVITIHTGVLTYILQKYEDARSLSSALKQLAGEIHI